MTFSRRLRALRFVTAVVIGGVSALAAGPAFADSSITYFNGAAAGHALALSVSPAAIASVDLSAIQGVLDSLNLPADVRATIEKNIGTTLANPTAPVLVSVDNADASGEAAQGTALTPGSLTHATSTPVTINATSLGSELGLLNKALTNIPLGTEQAIKSAISPLLASHPELAPAIATLDATLGNTKLADLLGAPSVNLTHSLTAQFGEDKKGDILTVNGGASPNSLLNPGSSFQLDPFEAAALPDKAFASNAVTSLNLVPSGTVSVPKPASVLAALAVVEQVLVDAENALIAAASAPGSPTTPVGPLPTVGGVLTPVIPVVNGTVNKVVVAGQTVDLTAVNALLNTLQATLDSALAKLAALDGLQMNDILSSGASTAVGSVQRDGGAVVATGFSQAAKVSAVKLNGTVMGLLQSAGLTKLASDHGVNLSGALVTVEGVTAHADVKLDGTHAPTGNASDTAFANASGNLAKLNVLGMDVNLPVGTSCTLQVPGTSTCAGVPSVPFNSLLKTPVLTVSITRGAYTPDAANRVDYATARIVTLEVTVDTDFSALANALPATGLTNAKPAAFNTRQPSAAASSKSLGPVNFGSGRALDLQLGVASAALSLKHGKDVPPTTSTNTCQVGCTPANTGNNVLPFAILAFALVAGGIGIGTRRTIFRRK